MEYPLAIIGGVASVSGILAVTAQLFATLSSFVDNVQEAPKEVRALNADLAAFYSTLTRIRLAVEAPRVSGLPEGWTGDFEKLAAVCLETLNQIKKIVDAAIVTETTSTATQMYKTVRITFKFKRLEVLRARLVSQLVVLDVSLKVLDE